jgi:hypothetical protein
MGMFEEKINEYERGQGIGAVGIAGLDRLDRRIGHE